MDFSPTTSTLAFAGASENFNMYNSIHCTVSLVSPHSSFHPHKVSIRYVKRECILGGLRAVNDLFKFTQVTKERTRT